MKHVNILKQFSHGKLSYKQDLLYLKYKRYTESIKDQEPLIIVLGMPTNNTSSHCLQPCNAAIVFPKLIIGSNFP